MERGGRDGGWGMNLLPMVAGLGSAAFFFMPGANVLMMVMGGLTFASSFGFVVLSAIRQRNGGQGKAADARRDYLRYLAQVRGEVIKTAEAQRAAALWVHPEPDVLWSIVAEGQRLWERRVGDGDFLAVRFGVGTQKLATPLVPPDTAPLDELEPLCADALRRFLAVRGSLTGLPVAMPLRSVARVLVSGEAYETVVAILAQIAVFHSPDDVQICVLTQDRGRWDWVKWLPHVQHPADMDAVGSRRMVYDDALDLERALESLLVERPRFSAAAAPLTDRPHLIVVLDTGMSWMHGASRLFSEDGLLGVTVLEVSEVQAEGPRRGQVWLDVFRSPETGRLGAVVEFPKSPAFHVDVDVLSSAQAEGLARQLAPLRLPSGSHDEPLLQALDFTDLLGVGDAAEIDPVRLWGAASRGTPNDRLRVPIGVGEDGRPVMLDLKEAALGGMGPHGLCVGATGSGKSELLRSLVAALALTHSSEAVNFILADFKGGATFAGLAALPHVAAVITNLADDLSLVDRMRDALHRRVEPASGAAAGQRESQEHPRLRAGSDSGCGPGSAAFAGGRRGRVLGAVDGSAGVHRHVLADRADRSVARCASAAGVAASGGGSASGAGHVSVLSAWIEDFSASESRVVLGVSDAYTLPSVPGSGFLKYETDTMTRFKAAYVSGGYGRTRAMAVPAARSAGHRRVVRFSAEEQVIAFSVDELPDLTSTTSLVALEAADYDKFTVLDVIVDRLAEQGPAAHRVWLPPLDEAPRLEQILGGVEVTTGRGLGPTAWAGTGRLVVPIGVVDKPAEQRQDPQVVELGGAGGHVLVVGGPRSGKSTVLRTLMFSLALTHTPQEVRFLCLDFGGGALGQLARLPHVSGVAGRSNPDLVRRIVAEVVGVLDRREAELEVGAAGSAEHVFLVIDGWAAFAGEFDMVEAELVDVARRGLTFGVHLVVAAGRWADVRAQVKDAVSTRIELRLGDPMESEMDRRAAGDVPQGVPGRGITKGRLHTLGAAPEGAELAAAIDEAWTGERAPTVRMLPTHVEYAELVAGTAPETSIATDGPAEGTATMTDAGLAPASNSEATAWDGVGIPIGVEENRLSVVSLDFTDEPHFLVFGEGGSGKSNFLRLIARGVCGKAERDGDKAMFVVVDYRRSLMEVVPDAHLVAYTAAAPALVATMDDLVPALRSRLPGPDVTPEQLKRRSWWTGTDVYVLVDDYDLVATAIGNPLAPLVELLPYARDIGLHLILARQSGGAGRAVFDPVIQRLRELHCPGLLLSGDRDEGQLIGSARPSRQPVGRGQLVTRREGSVLVQTAWSGQEAADRPRRIQIRPLYSHWPYCLRERCSRRGLSSSRGIQGRARRQEREPGRREVDGGDVFVAELGHRGRFLDGGQWVSAAVVGHQGQGVGVGDGAVAGEDGDRVGGAWGRGGYGRCRVRQRRRCRQDQVRASVVVGGGGVVGFAEGGLGRVLGGRCELRWVGWPGRAG